MTAIATWPGRAESWLDERGKGAWIAAMVLGFILFWPLGLALLAYMIWGKRMFRSSCKSSHSRKMRRHGLPNPYEQLKALTRGQGIDAEAMHQFITGLAVPQDARIRLLALTPGGYTGLAERLAKDI